MKIIVLFIYTAAILLISSLDNKEEAAPVCYKYMEKKAASDTTGIQMDSNLYIRDILEMNKKFMRGESKQDKC